MSLRKQLLAFGLLTLVLPWAGYRVVQEMETALRGGLEQALLASAGTVAAAVAAGPVPRWPVTKHQVPIQRMAAYSGEPTGGALQSDHSDPDIYAPPLGVAPGIDGLRDDWREPPDPGTALSAGGRYWAGVHDRYVYLYVAMPDQDIVYEGPPGGRPYGDRLVLTLGSGSGAVVSLLLATRAPGVFRARRTMPPLFKPGGEYEPRVIAAWIETAGGYAIEARVPLELTRKRLGIAVIDVNHGGNGYQVAVSSTWNTRRALPGLLIHELPGLNRQLGQFSQAGSRFRIVNPRGWVLADTGAVVSATAPIPAAGVGDRLFSAMLRRSDPSYRQFEPRPGRLAGRAVETALTGRQDTAWYVDASSRRTVVTAAVPIRAAGRVVGAVVLEQTSDPILTLTNRALLRLMSFTLLAAVIAALGLFGYATFLSFRVRRLARAAETALGPKGEIEVRLPGRRAGDEIGDLSRSFSRLLARLREHTEYLKTLASKLSHELRTPLAVVSTSLDNLEHEVTDASARPYLDRLRHGAARLDGILAAMGEATRMEQAINDTVTEDFNLAEVVESCCRTFGDIYTRHCFSWRVPPRADVFGSPELTAQLLDKLIDNAVGFSPEGSTIEIVLEATGVDFCLRVINSGPLLPTRMRGRLFDSLVSVRGYDDGEVHLGLGLHVVALVAEFHGGYAKAQNQEGGAGVVFSVWYPRPSGSPSRRRSG